MKRFFDRYWENPKCRKQNNYRDFVVQASQYAYSLIGSIREKKVLEIGPGEGEDTYILSQRGGKIFAIDISLTSLKMVQKRMMDTPVNLLQMDACNLGFKESVFDVIFLRTVLMHLDRRRFFAEANRLLKKDGKIVIIEPLRYNPFVFLYRALFSYRQFPGVKYFCLKEVNKIKTNFSIRSQRQFYFFSVLLLGIKPFFPAIKKRYPVFQNIDTLLFRLLPPLKHLAWFTVIEGRNLKRS